MEIIVSDVKLTGFAGRNKAIVLKHDGKFYCLHHQSTLHGFLWSVACTKKQLTNGASFEKMVENSKFFEVTEAVSKKGNKYFKQV